MLSTAGGLVFAGSNEGNVFALDARTREPLRQFEAGGPIRANPISFSSEGRQYVATGRAFLVFALPA